MIKNCRKLKIYISATGRRFWAADVDTTRADVAQCNSTFHASSTSHIVTSSQTSFPTFLKRKPCGFALVGICGIVAGQHPYAPFKSLAPRAAKIRSAPSTIATHYRLSAQPVSRLWASVTGGYACARGAINRASHLCFLFDVKPFICRMVARGSLRPTAAAMTTIVVVDQMDVTSFALSFLSQSRRIGYSYPMALEGHFVRVNFLLNNGGRVPQMRNISEERLRILNGIAQPVTPHHGVPARAQGMRIYGV